MKKREKGPNFFASDEFAIFPPTISPFVSRKSARNENEIRQKSARNEKRKRKKAQ
jgi:hypothetical protein